MNNEIKCPECGFSCDEKICLNCGAELKPKTVLEKLCPACSKTLTPGKKFCASCGFSVDGKIAISRPPPTEKISYPKPVLSEKKSNHLPLIMAVIIITGVILGLVIFAFGKNKIFPASSTVPAAPKTETISSPVYTPQTVAISPPKKSVKKISDEYMTVTASDSRDEIKASDEYRPALAVDGINSTAWNAEGSREKWIKLSFPDTIKIAKIGIIPGYDKKRNDEYGDRWINNNRIRFANLIFSNGMSRQIKFKDNREMQYFEFDPPVNTSFIKLEVDSIYRGNKFDDTCISEIEVYQLTTD